MEHEHGSTCSICGLVPLARGLRRADRVIARSAAMQELLKRAARFAPSEAPVMVRGETGTGKEVIARTLHANGPRAGKPFVAVNVAALPAELLESELFGHGKGAFTGAAASRRGLFEEANEGTLFLDEIGEMALPLQAKLLRALQDGEVRRVGENRSFAVDARIVCATHRDLASRVAAGQFREDLYFRLKVLTLNVPPLRERPEDVLPLALQFLGEEKRPLTGFTEAAKARLLAHSWPGNVRELQNAVKHGAALAQGALVDRDDLPEDLESSDRTPSAARGQDDADALQAADGRGAVREGTTLDRGGPSEHELRSLAEVEREHILRVLDACGGSQAEAARVLGIARNTLWRKLRGFAETEAGGTQGARS
ncbi:sigma-54 interaction domain-containing protein [Vulgatibacter incomptus]|uniref:Response regulator of zinc sigma-54-dependent two-component system n=1 Tax=Vulgatibacter incomptus TaxID=1391653 RepID=A0A0K1PDG6_9BACT|nr:sigma-54 dependent transcriptional regulator [Vulgatibacter incomptus]AKU91159.1 Response regulator of zinc sigma-54-dependent two-component system [Vulgatibacter incomptus]